MHLRYRIVELTMCSRWRRDGLEEEKEEEEEKREGKGQGEGWKKMSSSDDGGSSSSSKYNRHRIRRKIKMRKGRIGRCSSGRTEKNGMKMRRKRRERKEPKGSGGWRK